MPSLSWLFARLLSLTVQEKRQLGGIICWCCTLMALSPVKTDAQADGSAGGPVRANGATSVSAGKD